MAKNNNFTLPNTYKLGGGFNITKAEPIDARIVVNDIADVVNPENWNEKGSLYNGLVVSDTKGVVKVLIHADNYTSETSWVEVGAKGYKPHSAATDPSSESTYPIGQIWVNTTNNTSFVYVGESKWKRIVTSEELSNLGNGDMLKSEYAKKNVSGAVDKAVVAGKLEASHKIELIGDATGEATFDGSADASITVTLQNSVTEGTYPKVTVNSKGIVTGGGELSLDDIPQLPLDKIGKKGLGSAAEADTGLGEGNVPVLDADGKLNARVIPSIAITDVRVVTTRNDMLGLTDVQKGDVVIVTTDDDKVSRTYILYDDSEENGGPSKIENWHVIEHPDAVTSVNKKSGNVTLTTDDIQEGKNKYYTDDLANKAIYNYLTNKDNIFILNGGNAAGTWDKVVLATK